MQTINDLAQLRNSVAAIRTGGRTVGLVPTMGALHSGHMSLVKTARAACDVVITSIFVNPTQFGEGEDLDNYPRTMAADCALLEAEGVDIVWAPTVNQVYPTGFSTKVHVGGVSEGLCGGTRPGHFDGVALVVAKLFNQTGASHAFFGEKDYQQLAVIRRMARDLDFALQIIGVPTVRDADGLALSSRNAYLSEPERAAAVALPNALIAAITALHEGKPLEDVLAEAKAAIVTGGFQSVDYIELRHADTLEKLTSYQQPSRLIAAAKIGPARLIDNMAV